MTIKNTTGKIKLSIQPLLWSFLLLVWGNLFATTHSSTIVPDPVRTELISTYRNVCDDQPFTFYYHDFRIEPKQRIVFNPINHRYDLSVYQSFIFTTLKQWSLSALNIPVSYAGASFQLVHEHKSKDDAGASLQLVPPLSS